MVTTETRGDLRNHIVIGRETWNIVEVKVKAITEGVSHAAQGVGARSILSKVQQGSSVTVYGVGWG